MLHNHRNSHTHQFVNSRLQSKQIKRMSSDAGCDMAASQINLNAEILRIQCAASSKQIEQLYSLDKTGTVTFFERHYLSLPLSKINPINLIQAGIRLKKSQDRIYLGQVHKKKKHGKGIVIYKDGRVYEGHFYENQKIGEGVELYSNGNLYIGDFSQNKKHGRGSFYWFSLCTAACTKSSGMGIQQYHGGWWGGLPDGDGEHTKNNGDYYVGKFKNGLKHGQGIQYYGNGDIYKGEYINGLPEGYGQYTWSDGSEYKGDFKQGYRNGYGVWIDLKKGHRYQGHYLLDRKHGYGVFEWQKIQQQFKGYYVEDMRTGEGQLYEKGQLVYKGLWENGKQLQIYTSMDNFTPLKQSRDDISRNFMTSSQFRVKTAKRKVVLSKSRNQSASTTKKRGYQINFTNVLEETRHCHRGCMACNKRPKLGEYSQKNLTPTKSTNYK